MNRIFQKQFTWIFTLVVIALLAIPLAVFADDISNNLDASVDAVAEVMPLTIGGANGMTQLYVIPKGGDGKSGCNLTGSTTLVVAVNSDKPSVATVSPSSITFGSCGDTPTLTITPMGLGSATISLSQVSNSTAGTFDLAPATFTVSVALPPNTPPSISVTGVNGGASYEIGSAPTAGCSVTDAEDGNSTFPATLSAISGPLAAYGLGEQTAFCSYTDNGGLTASAAETYGIVDTTAPVITFVSRTPANGNGWNNSDVTVNWSCADNGSGVVAASVSQTVSGEGANQSATGACTDNAGNTASDTQSGINIDKTAPTASASATVDGNAYSGAWTNQDVIVGFSGTDAGGSELASCSAAVTVSSEGANQTSPSGTCTDNADNVSVPVAFGPIHIDRTAPTVSLVDGPADGGVYYFGSVPAAPTCSASDALSGLTSACSVSGYSNAVGTHTVTTSASDNAGNSASASASYTVLAFEFPGFYQPVDMNGVKNTVKGGSTVPMKFEIFVDHMEVTDTSKIVMSVASATCVSGASADIELLTSGSTILRYDLTTGQFIFNWKTPKSPGKCYNVTATFDSGPSITALFELK